MVTNRSSEIVGCTRWATLLTSSRHWSGSKTSIFLKLGFQNPLYYGCSVQNRQNRTYMGSLLGHYACDRDLYEVMMP